MIAPASGILGAKTVTTAVANTGLTAAGIASATFKVAALTSEFGAYATGKDPDWNIINTLNGYSDAINTATMITGTFIGPPQTPLDFIAAALGAATDAGTKTAAQRLGTKAGSNKEEQLSKTATGKKNKSTKHVKKSRGTAIAGVWDWEDGQVKTFKEDGTVLENGKIKGNWAFVGGRKFEHWSGRYKDELTLSKDGNVLSGFGYAIKNPGRRWKMRCTRIK